MSSNRLKIKADIDRDQIIEAIRLSGGNLSNAAKRLGVSRQTLYSKIRLDDEILAELRAGREELLDLAENVIRQALEKNDLRAAMFVIKNFSSYRRHPKALFNLMEDC